MTVSEGLPDVHGRKREPPTKGLEVSIDLQAWFVYWKQINKHQTCQTWAYELAAKTHPKDSIFICYLEFLRNARSNHHLLEAVVQVHGSSMGLSDAKDALLSDVGTKWVLKCHYKRVVLCQPLVLRLFWMVLDDLHSRWFVIAQKHW